MRKADVTGPLSQFQAELATRDGTFNLLTSLNTALGEQKLSDDVLCDEFELRWPQFEEGLQIARAAQAMRSGMDEPPRRPPQDILEELLELVRQRQQIVHDPTAQHAVQELGDAWRNFQVVQGIDDAAAWEHQAVFNQLNRAIHNLLAFHYPSWVVNSMFNPDSPLVHDFLAPPWSTSRHQQTTVNESEP